MTYNAIDIANAFIQKGIIAGQPVTHMKLHKLLYYAQGIYLALRDKPLFPQDFKKWEFGPVCPSVYRKFKKILSIPSMPMTNPHVDGCEIADPEVHSLVDAVWNKIGGLTAFQLSEMTHLEKPWVNAKMYETISKDSIREYFVNMIQSTRNATSAAT